ncbi:MAG: hypothetical protein JO182_06665, partial [Acidobacteriaceae bacterium]|nr:hypothetical protein [Acidobacteriaceae bacterium]
LGKIAVVLGKQEAQSLTIQAWVMSCRAFSRRIEHQTVVQLFERFAVKDVIFDFTPTVKNKPVSDFLKEMIGEELRPGVRLSREAFRSKCPALYHQVVETNE